MDAHIPEEYIDSERLRLEAYQKLSDRVRARPSPEGQIDLVLDELADRYGEPPDAGRQPHRASRGCAGSPSRPACPTSSRSGTNLRVAPADLPDSIQVRLQRMYPGSKIPGDRRRA